MQAKDKLVLFLRREVEKRRKRTKRSISTSVSTTSECPIDIDAVLREEFGALLCDDAIVSKVEESLLSRYLRCVDRFTCAEASWSIGDAFIFLSQVPDSGP